MITKELLQQAIKETAEGMLSGDPDYACKCVQARDGSRVRVIGRMSERCRLPMLALYEYPDGDWTLQRHCDDGAYLQSREESRYDLIPVPRKPRKLKCWVRFGQNRPDAEIFATAHVGWEFQDPAEWEYPTVWVTDPIEVVTEEKECENEAR